MKTFLKQEKSECDCQTERWGGAEGRGEQQPKTRQNYSITGLETPSESAALKQRQEDKGSSIGEATAVAEPFEAVCQSSLISRVDKNTHLLDVKWSLVRIISYALSPSAVTCNYIYEQSSGPADRLF